METYDFLIRSESWPPHTQYGPSIHPSHPSCFESTYSNILECLKSTHFQNTYQYKYGFSRSILTELMGSSRNHVVNVKPFSYGHLASGGKTTACMDTKIKWKRVRNILYQSSVSTGYILRAYMNVANKTFWNSLVSNIGKIYTTKKKKKNTKNKWR